MKLFYFILAMLLTQCVLKKEKMLTEREWRQVEREKRLAERDKNDTTDSVDIFPKIIYKDTSGNVYSMAQAMDMLGDLDYFMIVTKPREIILYPMPEEAKSKYLNIKPEPTDFFTTGSKFSSFRAKDINGKMIDLNNLAGKIIVFNYWFIGCPPCRKEIPRLNKMVDEYRSDTNIVFIAIAPDKNDAMKKFLDKSPFDYQIIPDGADLIKENCIESFPTHVVVNKEGNIIFHASSGSASSVLWIKKSIEEAKSP